MDHPFHRLIKIMPSGCWEWTGFRDRFGYGKLGWKGRYGRRAHRIAYELAKGPIAEGLFVCHSCDNRACCNPEHLWLGDNRANQADASLKGRSRRQSETHCINGHEWTPENTSWRVGTVAGRTCRACSRERTAKYQSRKTAELRRVA